MIVLLPGTVALAPIAIAFMPLKSAISCVFLSAYAPIAMLSFPVVTFDSASDPIAMLLLPVVTSKSE